MRAVLCACHAAAAPPAAARRAAAAWAHRCSSSSSSSATTSSSNSSSSTVDQMIQYARSQGAGQHQQALDVLRTGLALPCEDVDRSRLYLALAEAHASDSDWGAAAQAAESAAYAAAAASPPSHGSAQLLAAAVLQQQRAVLTAGWDDVAHHLLTSSSTQALQQTAPSFASAGLLLQLQHAAGDAASARGTAAELQDALPVTSSSSSSSSSATDRDPGPGWDLSRAVSWIALGNLQLAAACRGAWLHGRVLLLAQGDSGGAAGSYQQADALTATAAAAAGAQPGSSSGNGGSGGEPTRLWSPEMLAQLRGDALMGQAQVAMAAKDWGAAEDLLGRALSLLSSSAGDGQEAPGSLPLLLLLGQVYSRSARVVFAEGMLRQVARLLGLTDPHRLAGNPRLAAAHPSMAAAAAWRYSQLLTALPSRGSEASAWAAAAEQLWERAGQGLASLGPCSRVLGEQHALTGRGSHGLPGVTCSLMLRRLLPPVQ